jgi:FkbM family methyltransferase
MEVVDSMSDKRPFGMSGPSLSLKGRVAGFVNSILHPLGIKLERARSYPTLLQRALKDCPRPLIVEVGAFYPGHTVEKIRADGHCADFILFEPSSFGFEGLQKAYSADPHIKAEKFVVSNFDGEVEFVENDYGGASSVLNVTSEVQHEYPWMSRTRKTPVSCIRLDSYFEQHPSRDLDLLIIDVQGYEDRVLQGASETLRRTRYCLVEVSLMSVYENGARPEKTLQLLSDAGFDVEGNSPVWGSSATGDLWELDVLFRKAR